MPRLGGAGRKFDPDRIGAHVESFVAGTGVFIAEREGRPVGLAMALIDDEWFSGIRLCVELSVFVAKPHRDGFVVRRLLAALEGWGSGRGAEEMRLGVMTSIDADRTMRLYGLLGYEPCDTMECRKVLTPAV